MTFLLVNLLAAASILAGRILSGSWFSPLAVFGAIWGTSLGLMSVTTADSHPLQTITWQLIFAAWISFFLGALLTGPAYREHGAPGPGFRLPAGFRNVAGMLSVLALAGSIRFAWVVVQQIGLPTYLSKPMTVRHLLTVGGLSTGSLTPIFLGITLAASALAGCHCAVRPRSPWNYFPPAAAVLFDVFSLGRAHTIVALLIFVSALALTRRAMAGVRRQAACPASQVPADGEASRPAKSFWNWLPFGNRRWGVIVTAALIAGPYVYITLIRDRPSIKGIEGMLRPYVANISQNWYLVDDVVSRGEKRTPGANTLLPVLLVMHKAGFYAEDPRRVQLFSYSGRDATGRLSNTYTVVGACLADYGPGGVVVYLFLIGFGCNALFVFYRRAPRIWHVIGLSFVYPMLLFTVQGHQLSSPPFVMGVGLSVSIATALGLASSPASLDYRESYVST